ncbi:MarR family winged helix-turn-helix transcriptional regulator [Amycolatopsis magusensis]|uniref:MarR family winged helix-turn-helix transcriptional regulator n=1 Tax=Amycolatopsis magusensis TaxID=882444 RepID=UPI00379FF64C
MEEIPERLRTKPSWLITQLAVHARRLVSESFTEAGAKGYHYRILAALQEFGPSSQADLGRRCHVDRSDVVAAVNQLVDLGHVDRTPDPAHGRRNIVSLTPAGAAQLLHMDALLTQAQTTLLAALTPADRHTLTHLLTQALTHHTPD